MQGQDQDDAPKQSYRLLRRFLPRRLQPFLRGVRKRVLREGYRDAEPFRHIYAHTQTSIPRQDSLLAKACQLVEDGVEGDFVECGVLDGGTAALMAYAARDDLRKVHLFDAWQGLPEVSAADGDGAQPWVGEVVGSPKRVVQVLRRVGANMDNVVFHKGWFEETLPQARIGKIALLHIDCDFHDPTLLVLRSLVPQMVSGGWVQIDDYTSFRGCRTAVDRYLSEHPRYRLIVEDRPGGAIYFRIP